MDEETFDSRRNPAKVRRSRLARFVISICPTCIAARSLQHYTSGIVIHQEAFMLLAQIMPDRIDALRATLARMNQPSVATNGLLPFGQLKRVHFARFLILDEGAADDGTHCPASLVFSTCYDPPFEKHLDELLEVGEAGLRAAFEHCEGFSENASRQQLIVFLNTNRKTPETFYVGVRGRSLMQICAEAALREHIQGFLDSTQIQSGNWSPRELRERIRQDVLGHKDSLGWAAEPDPAETKLQRLWDYRWFAVVIAVALAALFVVGRTIGFVPLVLLIGLAVGAFALLLRKHEESDRANHVLLGTASEDDAVQINDRIKRLAEFEDFGVNNQFSSLNRVKRGRFRKFTQWAVLTAINFAARYLNNQGRLADIPTIHFARWVMVDAGRRLLFESNFDGSWERYLGDFVDKARTGLTAVWSNTMGFPPSKWLIHEGAADEQPFKWVARVSQIETQVWYSAYPNLTVKNILNNREIHRGLFGEMSDAKIGKWLKRL